jgi:type I restriction enzyme S subunit
MSDKWEEIRLGDVITTKKGFAFKSSWYVKSGVPVVRVSDFTDNSISDDSIFYVTEKIAKENSSVNLECKDIIIQTVGSWQHNPASIVGKVVRVPLNLKGSLLNQNAVKLIPNQKVLKDFLYYRLKEESFKYHNLNFAQGAANQASITLETIRGFKFSLPPLDTQRKIANILSGYDDLIENNQKRIKILEEMAQQTYEEWFVRMRFPGYETAVFDENGLPEGWEKVKIQDLCTVSGGGTPSKANDEFWENGKINWFTPTDLSKNKSLVISESELKTNELGIVKSSAKVLQPDSFIMTSRATIGLFALLDKPFSTNQGFINTTPNNSNLKAYLLYNFKSRIDQLMGLATGATFPELSKSKFKVLKINRPSDIVLSAFEDFTKKIFSQLFNLSNQNQRLREARDILLPRLMMGMIDVSGSLVQVESVEAKPTDAKVIPLEQPKKEASKEFKEAVLIACLTERFGSEKFPLGRKRYTKLSYLFHRYSDNKIQDYLRKAAGPYNPKTKYGGPEKIALNNKYIQNWKSDNKITGFVSAEKIEDAKTYFSNYWQISDLDWLTAEFKFKSNDELELLATVDNSLVELSKKNLEFTSANVMGIIKFEKEWEAKLERTIFSDANVERAIGFLRGVLEYEK